jgi:hypothetical protein
MAQKSFYVLIGHGEPLTKRTLTAVPDNGTMIKMIPGTCTPARTAELTEHMMRYRDITPAALVEELNNINSTSSAHRSAFRIYEPSSMYSDSQIVIEDTKLLKYVFRDANVVSYDDTVPLHEFIKPDPHDPEHIQLSRVQRYLAMQPDNKTGYVLVVLACMQINKDMDEFVLEQLQNPDLTIETVHERLKTFGYHGGKKSRMIKRSMRKKRRNRKTTQRHTTKRR